jgi:hypothetical protein
MKLDDLTLGEVKEISRLIAGAPTSSVGRWKVGQNYFLRTVTHHLMGRLEEVTPDELWFSSVSWIADDGRFNELLATGKPGTNAEIEPAPEGDVAIGRGSLIDAYHWTHALLRSVK